jgi:hypothetical protein
MMVQAVSVLDCDIVEDILEQVSIVEVALYACLLLVLRECVNVSA